MTIRPAQRSTWIAVALAAAAVVAIGVFIATVWVELAEAEMSGAGWAAMALGIIATLAVGCGLMALVFLSNRLGYDDQGGPEGGRRG